MAASKPIAKSLLEVSRNMARTHTKVEKVMHEFNEGTLRSGGSRKPVRKRKQAVAIALSEARRAGEHVAPSPKERYGSLASRGRLGRR